MFGSNLSVIHIKRNGIELIEKGAKEQLEFPPTVFQHLEITNQENFQKLILEFLEKLKFKSQKVIFLLSQDVLFEKEITPDQDLDVKKEQFLDSIPFSKEKIAKKEIIGKEKAYFFATNSKIFESIADVLGGLNSEVKAVIPITPFKEKYGLEGVELTPSFVNKIISDKDLVKVTNLFNQESVGTSEETPEVDTKGMNKWVIIIPIVVLLVAAGVALFVLRLDTKKRVETKIEVNNVENTQIEATDSAITEASVSATVSKNELKVQIFNGSGVAGQASAVQKDLEELGFSNIEVGNAEGTGNQSTTVILSNRVSLEVKDELLKDLEETFEEVTVQDTGTEQEFDIIITTGTSK